MSLDLKKFCPKVGGPCLKEKCVAFSTGVGVFVSSDSFKGKEGIHMPDFSKEWPIELYIDFHYCSHYEVNFESDQEYESLLKDFKPWKKNGEYERMEEKVKKEDV